MSELDRIHEIRLNDRGVGEDDVDRRIQHFSQTVSLDVRPQEQVERAADLLVSGDRRRRHRELAVENLVPAPVVRQRRVVTVREDRPLATHAPIVGITRVSGQRA